MAQQSTITPTTQPRAAGRPERPKGSASVFSVLGPYRKLIVWLTILAILANSLTLLIPRLVARGIDTYIAESFDLNSLVLQFGSIALGIFFFTCLQALVQTWASEKVARDIRLSLANKISRQGYRFIEDRNPSKLLTNLTSDIDAIKMFVAQVIVSLVTSTVIILGTATILLSLDWQLGLAVLTIIPLIACAFFVIIRKARKYFKLSREVIDWLNKVIQENIMGSALIRVLNATTAEHGKFKDANLKSLDIGINILRLFSFMIPIITFVASMGVLLVVTLGGYFVIQGEMSLGSFAAFMSYVFMIIFPILIIGFMSNIIAQASASWARIHEVLQAPDELDTGTLAASLQGNILVNNINLNFGEKRALKNVSVQIRAGSRTAIMGPTAAGKTQLLNIMAGLTVPHSGSVSYDGQPLNDYRHDSFYPQIGLVFQDSILFNTSMRENIAFSTHESNEALQLAVATAELDGFIATLPKGLDTNVSERGTSLSGGQKQRIMLARALALNPRILFLDDFTARVDAKTEQKILANIARNYPDLTLISITQKIAPIIDYDQIILLMEGEVLAQGTHAELMHSSPEYVQIFNSQRSTSSYELRT